MDQSGYTVNYSLRCAGPAVRADRRLGQPDRPVHLQQPRRAGAEKLNGNGTYTTYAYDAAGNLTSEINYAPAERRVNSSFTYTYNVLNEKTSMTDAAGNITTYGYDAMGQLTQVTLPGGSTITYVYNAAGDRTEVINSGATTSVFEQRRQRDHAGRLDHLHLRRQRQPCHRHRCQRHDHLHLQRSEPVDFDHQSRRQRRQTFQYSPLGFMVGTTTTTGGTPARRITWSIRPAWATWWPPTTAAAR